MQYLFLIYFTTMFSVGSSNTKLTNTYNTLNVRVGLHNIKLTVAKGDFSLNGWTDGHTITVTEGLLSIPPDEFAFVVGHEMAHVKYGSNESYADTMSVSILQASGKYNACKGGTSFFKRLLKEYGDTGGGLDPHPKTSIRLKTIQQIAC